MRALLLLALMLGALSPKAKAEDTVNACIEGRCALAAIDGKKFWFYTADPAKYQELKGLDKSFPIKLTSEGYYAQASNKSPTVNYTDEEIERLGEEYEDSGTLCKVGVIACAASTAWFAFDAFIKKDFVSAPFSFVTAITTCAGSYIQCKDYWRKYNAYKSAFESKYGYAPGESPTVASDPTLSSNPSTGTGGVTGTTTLPPGTVTSTDMPHGGWGSPLSTAPILPEHER